MEIPRPSSFLEGRGIGAGHPGSCCRRAARFEAHLRLVGPCTHRPTCRRRIRGRIGPPIARTWLEPIQGITRRLPAWPRRRGWPHPGRSRHGSAQNHGSLEFPVGLARLGGWASSRSFRHPPETYGARITRALASTIGWVRRPGGARPRACLPRRSCKSIPGERARARPGR